MLLKLVAEGCFSAIAASFNLAVKQDCAKARNPLLLRVCRAWHVTMAVEVRQPGFRRAEG